MSAVNLERERFSSELRKMHDGCRCSWWRRWALRKVIFVFLSPLRFLGLEKSHENLDVPFVGNGEESHEGREKNFYNFK